MRSAKMSRFIIHLVTADYMTKALMNPALRASSYLFGYYLCGRDGARPSTRRQKTCFQRWREDLRVVCLSEAVIKRIAVESVVKLLGMCV